MSQPPPSTPEPQEQPEGENEDSQTPPASDAEETQPPAAAEPPGDEPAPAEASSDSEEAGSAPEAIASEATPQGDEAAQPPPDWPYQPLPPQKTSLMKVGLLSLLAVVLVFSGGVAGYFLFKPDETDGAVQDPDVETPTETPPEGDDDADEDDDGASGSSPAYDVSYPELGSPWEEYDIEDPQTPVMIYSENWIIEVSDGWVAVAHYGLLDRARVNYNASEMEQTIEQVADDFVQAAFWAQTNLETTEIEYTELDVDGAENALLAEFRASWDQDDGIFEVPDGYEDIAILLADIDGRDAVISILGIPESENDRYEDTVELFDDISVS